MSTKAVLAAMGALVLWLGGCDEDGATRAPAPPAPPSAPATSPGGGPDDPAQPDTQAEALEATTWDLVLSIPDGLRGPRMAEVFLQAPEGLRFVKAETGVAALAAGKQVVVRELAGGKLRLIVFAGGNVETLGVGALARVTFERGDTVGGAPQVLHGESAFAPAELAPRPETLALVPVREGAR